MQTDGSCHGVGPAPPSSSAILTPDAPAFVRDLHRACSPTQNTLNFGAHVFVADFEGALSNCGLQAFARACKPATTTNRQKL